MNKLFDFDLKYKHCFEELFENINWNLCEFNFTNLFSWGEIYKIRWKDYNGRTVIYNELEDFIYMPVGRELSPESILHISDEFKEIGKSGNYMFFSVDFYKKNKEFLLKYFKPAEDIDNYDYIYKTEKLAYLKGRKLSKKRNLISQFERNNPDYIVKKLNRDHKDLCFDFSVNWCKERIDDKISFEYELSAVKRLFDNFDKLSAEGLGIFIKDKLIAYSVFSRLNRKTFDMHFEKSLSSVKGASQMINRESAKYLLNKCEYINREQDMGLHGLRKNKRSYLPDKMGKSLLLIRK